MADRRDTPDEVVELWDKATMAQKNRLIEQNIAEAVHVSLTTRDELRASQLPTDGDWAIWVILAGRGFGKTRAGAEWVHAMALEQPRRFALVGTSLDNARAVMVEGESGLLARVPQGGDVNFVASQRLLTWHNGSQARLFSGGEPDSLRGGQFDFAWGDEFAHPRRLAPSRSELNHMATIVLGTVGRLVGGPIGGIIGATLGGVIDNSLFGGGAARGGRLSNLAVQSAAYGEPIAVITGRMRAAGNLVWTSGIKESTGGGGKGQGSTYSYSASFAVGLAGRSISGVGRIWADGKLIRDDTGSFLSPIVMRLHTGDERQTADPLIVAVEGSAGAPAYRGIAYAVFEDLPLTDYGNRIPNLTFEVIADAGDDHDAGAAIAALARAEGRAVAAVEGTFPAISGHFAGQSGSIARALAPLLDLSGAAFASSVGLVARGGGGPSVVLPADDCHARLPGATNSRERRRLLGGETRIGGVEISFYDVARDFSARVTAGPARRHRRG